MTLLEFVNEVELLQMTKHIFRTHLLRGSDKAICDRWMQSVSLQEKKVNDMISDFRGSNREPAVKDLITETNIAQAT